MYLKLVRFLMISFLFLCAIVPVSAVDSSLSFRESDGQLYYETANTTNPASFIMNKDMQSGIKYSESMIIRNKTDDSYKLYLQLVPPTEQNEVSMELLDSIWMKIYLGTKAIYEGNATGLINKNIADLTQLTSIGEYSAGQQQELRVEYELDYKKELKTEQAYYVKSQYEKWQEDGCPVDTQPVVYSSQRDASNAAIKLGERDISYVESTVLDGNEVVSATTNWQFYAEKIETGKVTPIVPTTGDELDLKYIFIALGVTGVVILYIGYNMKRRDEH